MRSGAYNGVLFHRVVVDDDKVLAGQVILRHEELEKLEKQWRKTHTKRLNNGECTAQAGINYVDYQDDVHPFQTCQMGSVESLQPHSQGLVQT